MKILQNLRHEVKGEEFDYVFLMHHLRSYSKPRDKITRYLKNEDIIRVKKGLYVFGQRFRHHFVSLEILANLIYGPSYISYEYALAYYGMIPERVDRIASVTTHKNKTFHTPLGSFTYHHLPIHKYEIGITQHQLEGERCFLMASREKALVDVLNREQSFQSEEELWDYLIRGLRIEPSVLLKLNQRQLQQIAEQYKSQVINWLVNLLKNKR